jgi:hypothetical protein
LYGLWYGPGNCKAMRHLKICLLGIFSNALQALDYVFLLCMPWRMEPCGQCHSTWAGRVGRNLLVKQLRLLLNIKED